MCFPVFHSFLSPVNYFFEWLILFSSRLSISVFDCENVNAFFAYINLHIYVTWLYQ
jgi:hypothetical protein